MDSLSATYSHKIKTAAALLQIVGERPRRKSVIMCHGVFDVVHPGHLRHLLYAKSKADILIASITADIHINKGQYRPHVPQELRALNLAALEIVDYVIIDSEATPLANIAAIEPDFFAKGYEYVADGMPPKTSEEAVVVRGYGGEIIFTPGDIVYSSSKLIELAPPSIRTEKLLTMMHTEGIDWEDFHATIKKFKGKRVHVIGDTIVDSYTQTACIGGQTKTPTMSVLFERKIDYIGGAAVVAKHLRAAGADVVFSTVLGTDPLADFVVEGLTREGIECRAIRDATRPTTNKNAIVAGGYRLVKIDTLDNRSISDEIVGQFRKSLSSVSADAVVVSDFRHGIFNTRTIPPLIAAIQKNAYKVADSQVATRWGNILDFKGFDLITPNEREARFALADQESGIRPLASAIYDATQCKTLILKLGDRGVLTCRSVDHHSLDSFFVVDSFVDHLVDAVGAGDALLAYATLSMLATGSVPIATVLGSIAAACECEQDGNIPITLDKMRHKLDGIERTANYGG